MADFGGLNLFILWSKSYDFCFWEFYEDQATTFMKKPSSINHWKQLEIQLKVDSMKFLMNKINCSPENQSTLEDNIS